MSRDAMRAAPHSLDPDATHFKKRCLAAVLHQWELAGHPVPQDRADRVHGLIDAHAGPDAHGAALDELSQPAGAVRPAGGRRGCRAGG
ncbi:hypothetical protein OG900_26830 [Streptomyces sp. NBC_00433]